MKRHTIHKRYRMKMNERMKFIARKRGVIRGKSSLERTFWERADAQEIKDQIAENVSSIIRSASAGQTLEIRVVIL